MPSIQESINTLKAKGYSDSYIRSVQFGVPRGGNRRKNALAHAASTMPDITSNNTPAAPGAPSTKATPQIKQQLSTSMAGVRSNRGGSSRADSGTRAARRKKTSGLSMLGAVQESFAPLNMGAIGYQ